MHLSLGTSPGQQWGKINKRSSSIRVQTDNSQDNFEEVQNLLNEGSNEGGNPNHFGVTFLGSNKQVSDLQLAEAQLEGTPESKYPILIEGS
mmetsp:Transcript_41870/g.64082  ORF Transcript_41870/g.64082 Transcript_41870/m.64082 type:complete len:91 (+) Transcript_41870:5693-5965(+)